jgi:hypothetical protein
VKPKTNQDRIVTISVQGEVSAPVMSQTYRVGYDGVARVGPATGGIVYNVRIGDTAFGWAGDHIEPGVSTKDKDERINTAYNTLSCVGNRATVVSGEAKGSSGVVTGKHGGIEHVIIDFEPSVLDKMAVGDKILVRARGQGLEIEGFSAVQVMNCDPYLLDRMNLEVVGGSQEATTSRSGPAGGGGATRARKARLSVPVVAEVPAYLMGSGLGAPTSHSGDYDITTQDPPVLAKLGLDKLRYGDIVSIRDASSFYGRSYRRGAVIVGVIIHSDSKIAGHGPGVTTLLTCNSGEIVPRIDPKANLALLLGLRPEAELFGR